MPSNTIMKIIAVSLLVFSLVIGALLVLTIGERNVAQTALESTKEVLETTKEVLEEKKGQVIEEKTKRQQAEVEFNGCQAALGEQNKGIAEGQQQALASAADSVQRAGEVLSTLPEKIAQDRIAKAGPAPAEANKWLEGLLK